MNRRPPLYESDYNDSSTMHLVAEKPEHNPAAVSLAEAIMRMAAEGDGAKLAMVATALAATILDGAPPAPGKTKVGA